MDISALLSPSDAPPSQSTTASPKPAAAAGARSRNDSPAIRQSPRSLPASSNMASPSRHVAMQHRPPMPSPPGSNFSASTLASSFSTQSYTQPKAISTPPTENRPSLHRASTSGMDTLADLASMQQYHQQTPRAQPVRQNSNPLQRPRLEELHRQHSGSRGSIDMSKLETPKPQPLPQRELKSASLTDAELSEAVQLFGHLDENPHAYESHLRLTRLLRRGLRAHTLEPASEELRQDPRMYELVTELLGANEAMSERFAIGEELWQERLQDQQLLAFSVEECTEVIRLCEKAVSQEAGSTALWEVYGTWVSTLFQAGHGIEADDADMPLAFKSKWAAWTEDDRLVAREVFTWQQVVEVWRRGTQDTMYNINNSHVIWNKYVSLVLKDLERSPSAQGIASTREMFERRLSTPHEKWDQTFQHFSQFVSKFIDSKHYEDTMMRTKHQTQHTQLQYETRSVHEMKWRSAQQAQDQGLEWGVVSEYLEFELGQSRKKKKFSFDLSKALYQRALLRFPHVTTLWEDLFLFLADELPEGPRAQNMLPAMDRGTSHCPWSGTLWGHYIRAGELERLSFDDMSDIKHRASSKGLMDASPIEDHIIINTNWCSYLRRRAFEQEEVDEDELDVTEVGIRSALEETEIIGKRVEGDKYRGDTQYRLERIYIRFCTQVGDGAHIQTARSVWQKLIPRCGNSYEFWAWYFLWERFIWVKYPRDSNHSSTPRTASEVLKQGINNPTTDWPEKLIDDLLRHAEDYEDPAGQLSAIVTARKARKEVEKRRAREQEALRQQQAQALAQESESALSNGKRKRDDAEEAYDSAFKRSKPTPDGDTRMTDASESAPSQVKRDRENATIVVRNLPLSTHGRRVRNFFRDCGDIKSINVTDDGQTSTATIEFENGEDVLAALTRNGKDFEGQAIEVSVGTALTIWCANYPAVADEAYIRDLFEKHGEIVDIRFPSLKFNTHRRFCYIQFKTSEQAHAAVADLDGKPILEGDTQQKLIAKISDPSHRQNRSGALEEGRELYAKDVDWSATEDEVKEVFAKYGTVQSVRIPRNMAGKSKGFAFIVFATADQAQAALELNKTKFKSRLLEVSVAESKTAKRNATTVVRSRVSASPSPSITNGSTVGTLHDQGITISREEIAARTIALLDVPDTVNDARIRAIAELHGQLSKIVLRPDHGGAIIEYVDVASAGKASLALEGTEIVSGRRIRTGTVAELLDAKAEGRERSGDAGKGKAGRKAAPETKMAFGAGSGVVRRPGQPAGRRGGLGMKRGGAATGGSRTAIVDGGNGGQTEKKEGLEEPVPIKGDRDGTPEERAKPKSNADFKAMFLK